MYFTRALFVLRLFIDICYNYYIIAYSSHCNLHLRFWVIASRISRKFRWVILVKQMAYFPQAFIVKSNVEFLMNSPFHKLITRFQ